MLDFLTLMKEFGPWALIYGTMALAIYYQYKTGRAREKEIVDALCKEQGARVEDAKQYAAMTVELQNKTYATVEATIKRLHDEDKAADATTKLIDVLTGRGDKKASP